MRCKVDLEDLAFKGTGAVIDRLRDRAFTAPADPAARRDLLSRLAPHQDRVRWMTSPARSGGR